MSSKKFQDDTPTSDWNMGVDFYRILANLKEVYMDAIINQEYGVAAECLSDEIDWVGQDIGENNLKILRRRIDSIQSNISNGIRSKSQRINIVNGLKKVKRDLWDAELKAKITRPRDDTDLSNVPIAIINGR